MLGADASTSFTVSELTAVPGRTLPPGQYTIHVVDHLADRYILEVTGANGQYHTLFLGIPEGHLSGARGTQGMIRWSQPSNGADYLRGWRSASLPTALEFAYPKADAVAVAKANNAQVPAIDPESDHMVQQTSLSKDQMQIVTLWLLSPTKVGPNAPAGIAAKRYQEVARVEQPPVVKKLPHTASLLPLVWLAGAFSLLCGLGFRVRRLAFDR